MDEVGRETKFDDRKDQRGHKKGEEYKCEVHGGRAGSGFYAEGILSCSCVLISRKDGRRRYR